MSALDLIQQVIKSWVVLQRNVTINWEPLSPILNGPKTSKQIRFIGASPGRIWLLWGFKCSVDIPYVLQGVILGIGLVRSISSIILAILNNVLSAIQPRRLYQTCKVLGLISVERRANYYLRVILRNQHPFLLVAVIIFFLVLILQ